MAAKKKKAKPRKKHRTRVLRTEAEKRKLVLAYNKLQHGERQAFLVANNIAYQNVYAWRAQLDL